MRAFSLRTALVLALAAGSVLPAFAEEPVRGAAGAFLAVRVAASENDFRAAAGWYDRLMQAGNSDAPTLEGAVISHLSLGDIDRAAELARLLVQKGGRSQTAYIALLAEQAGRGDFAGLIADTKAGRSIGRLLDDLVMAWAALGDGRMSDAIADFDTVAKSPGLEAFGLYHKALALASVGDFEGADAILSGREAGQIALMRRGAIAHAQVLSQLERNPDALALLDRAFGAGADPQIDALRARLTAGEPVPFDIVTGPVDGVAEVFYTLATALRGEAEDGYTLIYARVVAHLRPDHSEARLLAAGLLESMGQHGLAGEAYAAIPADDPAYHVAEIGRADTLIAEDKVDAALEVLTALTRSHAGLVEVHSALGDVLRREERFADAIPAYTAAIDLIGVPDMRHWTLYYSRGISNERAGNWPEAEADFRRALELNPDQPQVLNYLGYSFVDRGENLDEALGMIERAVAAQPDAGYIIDSLAWALFRLGRYQEAVEPMERASLLEPVDPVVTDHLGDVYWAVGRKLEARFQWHRALSFDPEEKEAKRIRRKLEVGLDAVLAEEGAKPLTEVANGGN
ncbi:tetratricopeptide repeat protein [Rhodobacteraceae bacterium HSP-20]|uniref:Tetratricopeptide repeat protein n=1 Tax=Paragemmobacter amnigenus TaxID=2852097 RepID=A0ABS6J6A4_9RHOB|nr:tetratricopeptide repeat protein [Rhodobacter amnigenus]MBU9699062.1 tetratricopeptide repeat protein [Rhodobacter amnigenus]MBV4390289.1 tetratricopeptide repeat protein [Rhodobacter amnigenus]